MIRFILAFFLFSQLALSANLNGPLKKIFDARTLNTLEIANTNGRIFIEGTNSEQVEIVALKEMKDSKSKDEQFLEKVNIRFEQSNGTLKIKVEPQKSVGFLDKLFNLGLGNYKVNFEIRVPARFNIKAASTNGRIEIRNVEGKLNVTTTNGKIKAVNVNRVVAVRSTNGDVDVAFKNFPNTSDEIEITTTNGQITVNVPPEARFNLNAFTTNGEITYELKNSQRVKKTNRYLEIKNGTHLPNLNLRTTNGSIVIFSR